MANVIIVHNWGGTPESNWYPWLQSELENEGHEVLALQMPDTDAPVMNVWVQTLIDAVGIPDADTYFVGHSIGCQAILRYLDSVETSIGGAIFVAGWFDLINLETEEEMEIAKPWIETPIDLPKVATMIPESVLFISENDPFGCMDENIDGFNILGSKIISVTNAGHFTAEDGWNEVPDVLEELKGLMQ
ncbi:MAG: alpha/beta hydrolase [Patescibacteria group bacterium]